MSAAAAEHTCHGAIFCGQSRALAERDCPACPTPRPLLEVLEEHVARIRAQRETPALDPTSCYDCGAPAGTDHTDNPTHDFWSVADAAAGSRATFGWTGDEA